MKIDYTRTSPDDQTTAIVKSEENLLEELKAAQKNEIAVINELANEVQKIRPRVMNLRPLRKKLKDAHKILMNTLNQLQKSWITQCHLIF